MLIEQLPRESATHRARVDEGDDWGNVEHLLAMLIDATQAWGWANVGNRKNERPKPIPRPGEGPVRSRLSPKEMEARLVAQLKRRR